MNKKLLFAFAAVLFASAPALATGEHEHEMCGTMQNLARQKAADPTLESRMNNYETQLQQWIANNSNNPSPQGLITIPVVVHIVYSSSAGNISDNQVNSQIDAVNLDFLRQNTDAGNTPSVWQSTAANLNIQFCLAQRDPNGNPTTGIERRQTTVPSFTTDDACKFYSSGGLDAWDVSRYMNIWVVYFGGSGLLGYAEFPTGSLSNTYGVVVDYGCFGSNYTGWGTFNLFSGYQRGRTLTHEIGHCFNLRHIWGDESGCSGSDFCADTPNQAGQNFNCPTFPLTDACTGSSPGVMFMNYMDYTNDNCKNMFTNNQSSRANAVVNTVPYNSLSTSNGCVPVNLVNNDAGITTIITPNGNVCGTTFTPQVTLKNWGSNALTSCVINYQIDANPVQTQNWTGNLASLATTNVTLGSMTTTAGAHTFTCYTTLPNNVTDGNAGNDQTTSNFTALSGGASLPLVEGFESVTFPPTGWTLSNPDGSVTWARTTQAAKTGVASMWFNSINYPCNGCIDILTTPNLNFTTVTNPQLTFQVAYRMLSDPNQNPNWSDTLELDITTNCGQTWTQIYKKYSTGLTTIIPTFSTTPFVPTNSQWRLETINLSAYATAPNVFIQFKVTSDYENNMYVDDINIFGSTSAGNPSPSQYVQLYPNPTDGTLYLNAEFTKMENLEVIIYNVVGAEVGRTVANNTMGGVLTLDLKGFTNGVYFVKVKTGSETFTQKIILEKQ